jgi:predicted DNA-binding transcriptional regulator YafY
MPRSHAAPEERLRAIELLLLWEGRVSRGRLLELFEVHGTLASRDIATFRQAYPEACTPDTVAKAYDRTPWMKPQLTQGQFAEYQALIGAWPADAIAGAVPIVTSSVDATNISYQHFSAVHAAIRDARGVQITYRSLRNPKPHVRTIKPHALIQAGPRWHVRAYCAEAQGFRDFNLGRITAVSRHDADGLPGATEDADWQTLVRIRFVPHPDLDQWQSRLVRDEYMHGTVALVFELRSPMVRYLIHAFRAAIDPARETPPEYLLMVDAPNTLPPAAVWDRTPLRKPSP